jgi:hypothetical protein
MNARKQLIANGLMTGGVAIAAWTLFVVNRLIWLVGISTVLDDLKGAPDNLAGLLLLVASAPWWLLLFAAIIPTAIWVYQTYRIYSSIGLSRDEISRVDSIKEAIDQLRRDMPTVVSIVIDDAAVSRDRRDYLNFSALCKCMIANRVFLEGLDRFEEFTFPKLISGTPAEMLDADAEITFRGADLITQFSQLPDMPEFYGGLRFEIDPAPFPKEEMKVASPQEKHKLCSEWGKTMRQNVADYQTRLIAEAEAIRRRAALGFLLPPLPGTATETRP